MRYSQVLNQTKPDPKAGMQKHAGLFFVETLMNYDDMTDIKYMFLDKVDELKHILKAVTYDIQLTRILKHTKHLPCLSVWFVKDWWKYLVKDVEFYNYDNELFFFQHMWCRATGHPCGVWFYNSGGYEPDMHCQYCNDDTG